MPVDAPVWDVAELDVALRRVNGALRRRPSRTDDVLPPPTEAKSSEVVPENVRSLPAVKLTDVGAIAADEKREVSASAVAVRNGNAGLPSEFPGRALGSST